MPIIRITKQDIEDAKKARKAALKEDPYFRASEEVKERQEQEAKEQQEKERREREVEL